MISLGTDLPVYFTLGGCSGPESTIFFIIVSFAEYFTLGGFAGLKGPISSVYLYISLWEGVSVLQVKLPFMTGMSGLLGLG